MYNILCNQLIYQPFHFRYQFFLQVKQDILQGRLPAPFELLAELGAYAVQCKLDFFFCSIFHLFK